MSPAGVPGASADGSLPPPLQVKNKGKVDLAALPVDECPPHEFVRRVTALLSDVHRPHDASNFQFWKDWFDVVQCLSSRFEGEEQSLLYQVLRTTCQFDLLCANWIAVHYNVTYIQLPEQTGPFSVAATLNLCRLSYLQCQFTQAEEVQAWKVQLREKKHLYEDKWLRWGEYIASNLDMAEDLPPEMQMIMRIPANKKTMEATGLTTPQRFWVMELAERIHHFTKWWLYPPADVLEWPALLAFWTQQRLELDYVAVQLFHTESFLDLALPHTIQWFEDYTRWIHAISLQLFYANEFPCLQLQSSPVLVADRERLKATMDDHTTITLQTYFFAEMQDFVLQQHVCGSAQYGFLQTSSDHSERFFGGSNSNTKTADETPASYCVNEYFPLLFYSFLVAQYEGHRIESMYANPKLFLYPYAMLKVVDSHAWTWLRNKSFLANYVVTTYAWGTRAHWRFQTWPSSIHKRPEPLITQLFGRWMVRIVRHHKFHWVVARDPLETLIIFFRSLQQPEYHDRLSDSTQMQMQTIYPHYLSSSSSTGEEWQPYDGRDDSVGTWSKEKAKARWRYELYQRAELKVQEEENKKAEKFRLQALKDQAYEYDQEMKRQKEMKALQVQTSEWCGGGGGVRGGVRGGVPPHTPGGGVPPHAPASSGGVPPHTHASRGLEDSDDATVRPLEDFHAQEIRRQFKARVLQEETETSLYAGDGDDEPELSNILLEVAGDAQKDNSDREAGVWGGTPPPTVYDIGPRSTKRQKRPDVVNSLFGEAEVVSTATHAETYEFRPEEPPEHIDLEALAMFDSLC